MEMTTSIIRASLTTVVLAGLNASTVLAQAESSECRTAVAEFRVHPQNPNAIWSVSRCPSSGPAELAVLWGQPGVASGVTRRTVVDASGSLRDSRMFSAILGVARGSDRPVADRLAALQVLMRYYDARYAPSVENLTVTAIGSPITRVVGGPPPLNGASPLPSTTRQQIADVLAQLSAADRDSTMRVAALRLRQALAFDDPTNTPLRAGSVSLIAGCGSRVTLRSTADVELELQLRVLGTNFDKVRGIRAGSTMKPRSLLLSLPSGIVVASYGGREVARLTERNAPCAAGMTR